MTKYIFTKTMNESRDVYLQIRDRVEAIGATTLQVQDDDRFYSYSVGLAGYGLPDIIVFGADARISDLITDVVERAIKWQFRDVGDLANYIKRQGNDLLECFPDIANDLMWQCHKYYLEHDIEHRGFFQLRTRGDQSSQENSYACQ